MNLSELTKVAMHTAAERARIRRQEEEAEREAQKERARKKADELEKLIREKKEKEEREKKEKEEKEAREKAEREERERKQREESERTKSPGSARPKLALLPRSIPVPGSSTQSNDGVTAPAMKSPGPPSSKPLPPPSRADESGSWRSTAAPRTSRPQPSTSNAPPAMSNVSHAIEMLDNAVAEKAGDVPVIDFSDVGKLMAAENPSQVTAPPKRRPVASDFMEDDSPKFPTIGTHPSETSSVDSVTRGKKDAPTPLSTASPARRTVPLGQKSPGLHAPHYSQHRDKPSLPYKEAPLSSLSDAMSRIKATLDNMHQASASQSSSKASTSSSPQISPSPKPSVESFTVTREDDPLPSASSNEEVKVPKSAPAQKNKKKRVEQIPKSKLASFWRPRSEDEDLGWRVLSWDPPVNGMSKRSMSRDEVVFGLSGGGWGSKISTGGSKVKVQLPKEKTKEKSEVQLDDLAEDIKPMPQNVNSKPSDTASHGSSSPRLSLSRGKSLPAGTDVAFYKPPQVVINGATGSEETLTGIPSTSSVKFTVTSELEEGDSSSTVEKTEGQAESLPNGASADESVVASLHESTQSDEKSDETVSDDNFCPTRY
ncbi:hypothetical protein FRC03_004751 [Tulasnella sp. 419]|nr:hypothetical protein FRC03_004751 [Tulasnella sp. 419]